MKIGVLGLGKLGFPCAVAMGTIFDSDGSKHKVFGYDIADHIHGGTDKKSILKTREDNVQEMYDNTSLTIVDSIDELVEKATMIFVAVQTPHDPEYGGTHRIPSARKDFDYTWLRTACDELSQAIDRLGIPRIVMIISTVLPGTIEKTIKPVLCSNVSLCYNPYFIAMGTVVQDFLDPEFVLFGVDSSSPDAGLFAKETAKRFYATVHQKPVFETTIENAELIKVMYNTMISTKILFANNVMEICNSTQNTNCDVVIDALSLADKRLISPAYLRGGMGDGGGCHPRDNIAMSWLSRKLKISIDLFDFIMVGREKQTEYLAQQILDVHRETGYPVTIMGKAFKANTNLVDGSPAILLANLLEEHKLKVTFHDPHLPDCCDYDGETPQIFFMGCKHDAFLNYGFPDNSIVLDPHRYIPQQENKVSVIWIGAS